MLRIIPGWGQRSSKSSRRRNKRVRTEPERRWRRPALELLEERAMLSVAQDLQNQIAPYQSAINSALSAATSLPLVGHQFGSVNELNTLLQNTLQSIQAQTQSVTNGHHQLAIPLSTISHQFSFNLGLGSFLQVSTQGSVAASIAPVLNVGFDFDGTTVTLDTADTNVDIGFSLSLPNFQATASLNGFLYAHVADAGNGTDPGTSFSGHLTFGFGTSSSTVAPHFSGNAQIRFNLSLSFVDPALHTSFNPSFFTQLQVDWGIDSTSNQMMAPHIVLKNFGLDVDSFMHSFVGDIVTTVQKYTKPLQPFIDIFDTAVPIISAFDSSETMGDLLLKGAALSQDQQDRFQLMVNIIKAVNTIDVSGNTGAVVTFGDINLGGTSVTGDGQLAGGFSFDTSQISGVIDDIFNNPLLDQVQSTLQDVANYAGLTSTAGFQFPLLENPGPVLGGILTGQSKTMFSFSTGREHFELAPSIGVGIKDLIGVFLSAGIVFDADFTMGYDTAGLIKFVQDPLHKPEDLLHGFYFDNSVDTTDPPVPNVSAPKNTALYLEGFAALSASAVITISGGVYANVSLELASNDTSSHVYLDSMVQSISSNSKVFKLSGEVYASAAIELTFDTEVGPSITVFSYELARDELLNFNPPPSPSLNLPLVVIDVTNQHTLLLDPNKMTGGPVTVQPFHDFTVSSGGTFVGDGIRVDYPGEIDLFIERKDDTNTNYYNLIGVNGAVPDNVSLNIIDPFRMFRDEGATDPDPVQTKPGVILAGGKNVVFKYNEAGDGSQATVLLAGGYGSNTLFGGTMEFGNFIPAERIDQAKQHFGNVSGFDAAGVARINSSIDGDVAPANPAGIIGATMTASRGGLMFGGPGNNSFIATGAGAYEMIGGPWVDSFSISPSFNGVPATYSIDGGPGGQNNLIVRVPSGENVSFESSAIVDKYDPAFKALEIDANHGVAATAHGLTTAHIIAQPGSKVQLGDTSELNIEFSIEGTADLGFGGSNAPDVFNVTADYNFYGNKNLRYVDQLVTRPYYNFSSNLPADLQAGLIDVLPPGKFTNDIVNGHYANTLVAPHVLDLLDGPVYSIVRTFGSNNRTQTIKYRVMDSSDSSITLDGKGASDTYNITQGLGSFVDIQVDDSDTSTQNVLNVNFRNPSLLPSQAMLTSGSLTLTYYTPMMEFDNIVFDPGTSQYHSTGYHYITTSATYTPTVFFGGNVDIALHSARPFKHTIIDRPSPAPNQQASISFDGIFDAYVPPGMVGYPVIYGDAGQTVWYHEIDPPYQNYFYSPSVYTEAYDTLHPEAGFIYVNSQFTQTGTATDWTYYLRLVGDTTTPIDVLSNGGNLTINRGGSNGTIDIHGNTGTLTIHNYESLIGIAANTGTINFLDGTPLGISSTQDSLIDIGSSNVSVNVNANGSLANVHGTINIAGEGPHPGTDGIVIDDRGGTGTPTSWIVDKTHTQIGDLTVNFNPSSLSIYTVLDQRYRTGTPISMVEGLPFTGTYFNLAVGFPVKWTQPTSQTSTEGNAVNLSLANFTQQPSGTITYAATNLPTGLSLNATTGLITGTVAIGDSTHSPYQTTFTVTAGSYSVTTSKPWTVVGAISINLGFTAPVDIDEGVSVSLGPITTTNPAGLPVTLSVTGLPSWLTYNSTTKMITGTSPIGESVNGAYHARVNATDGTNTGSVPFDVKVSSIKFGAISPLRLNRWGDTVSFAVPATTMSGRPLTYSLSLPFGLTVNSAGVVSGTITGTNIQTVKPTEIVTATDGVTSRSTSFVWNILPPGGSDVILLSSPGPQLNRVGDSPFIRFQAVSPAFAQLAISATGLPPGFSIFSSFISGTVTPDMVAHSPYVITLTATDGLNVVSTSFNWTIVPAGPISVTNPGTITSTINSAINLQIVASTTAGLPLTYTASGLPPGLSINAQTGAITGTLSPLAALPSTFNTNVTVTDGANSYGAMFQWIVNSGSNTNIVPLPIPGGGTITLTSDPGTQLSASIVSNPGVGLPGGIQFPFGYVNFDITPLSAFFLLPGGSTTLTISGPNFGQANQYYKYGPTPANPTPHWYNFLYNQATDGDSATNTGMQVVGGNLVLHLIDGGRGDDDLGKNGDIHDLGGPAFVVTPPALLGDYDLSGVVDAADYVVWRSRLGQSVAAPYAGADGNGNGVVDSGDLSVWRAHFGATHGSGADSASGNAETAAPISAADSSASINITDSTQATPTAGELSLGLVPSHIVADSRSQALAMISSGLPGIGFSKSMSSSISQSRESNEEALGNWPATAHGFATTDTTKHWLNRVGDSLGNEDSAIELLLNRPLSQAPMVKLGPRSDEYIAADEPSDSDNCALIDQALTDLVPQTSRLGIW